LPTFEYKYNPKILSDSIISCIVYNAEPRLYYYCISENLGQTWTYYPYYISNDSARLGVEFFLNSGVGWGVLFRHKIEQTGDNIIIKTTDSGKNWIKKLDAWIEPAFTLLNINFIDSLKGISTSRAGKFLYSNDGGENWIKDSSFISEDISEIMTYAAFLSQKRFIISKILGQVFMYDEDGFTGVEEKQTENISTVQVFPNPATNQIEFKLQLNEPQTLKFEIFDILGNQALPKIELFSESTEFSQTIDISNLPTGVYYIVTSANKQKTAAKFIKVE
ncbi:MAG TPA: T9SS type A sorting domain-containing protein, partial [Candidatus Kapabacteria bacterium]|nr:T9SS type A sorting domain-containing protein [Candidatus Kapabacteria bacterium]HPO63394.1 T9SS type A sorting domain-containing protein [Candidatus Kapabacteria bacterium]